MVPNFDEAVKGLMNAEKYNFADFTREKYRNLLRLARKTYTFRSFDNYREDEKFIIWRHDVDFSPHAARKMAIIEAEEGVQATYFLLFHSEFYNLLEKEVTNCFLDIIKLGHNIGLHVDGIYHNMNSENVLHSVLKKEKMLLEDTLETKVNVFSFHITTEFAQACDGPSYEGLINAQSRYFREQVAYCSDSNGYWRFKRLEDVLEEATDAKIQVLTHPELWQETVMSPKQRVWRCIDGRAAKTKRYYEDILSQYGRSNIDWK